METKSRYEYLKEYRKKKLKRVVMDLPAEKYAEWKEACEALGQPLTAVVKLAMDFYLSSNAERDIEASRRAGEAATAAADVPLSSNA